MQTPIILEALDVCVPSLFVLIYFLGKMHKDIFKLLFRIWFVGLIFGFAWEPWGIGLWEYPNYSLYIYDGIPLALPFAWAWSFMICYLIALQLMQLIKGGRGAKFLAYYLSGVWFANLLESVAVAIGWWRYASTRWLSVPWPLVTIINNSPVHIMVYLGWGIPTLYNFLIAIPLFDRLKKRWSEKMSYSLLIPPATVVGTLSWFTIGILTWIVETFARAMIPF